MVIENCELYAVHIQIKTEVTDYGVNMNGKTYKSILKQHKS